MNVQLKKSYAEVGEILNVLGDSYKEKLPPLLLKLFEKSAQETSDIFINQYSDFETVEISREALVIISILNLKYWETDSEEVERLKRLYEENEALYKKALVNSLENENTNGVLEVTVYEPNTFIGKIKHFFAKLLK